MALLLKDIRLSELNRIEHVARLLRCIDEDLEKWNLEDALSMYDNLSELTNKDIQEIKEIAEIYREPSLIKTI